MIDRPLYYLADRKEPEQSSHASDRIAVPDQGWFPTASSCKAEKCQITRTPAGLTDTGIPASEEYQTLMAGCLE